MGDIKRLNAEQINKIRLFFEKINAVEKRDTYFDDDKLALLTGTYKLIEKVGGGDPIKAAEWRLRVTGSI